MNDRAFRTYLEKPPRAQHFGNQLSPLAFDRPASDPPPIQSKAQSPHLNIHLKESLKTGQLHYEQSIGVAQKFVTLFIDDRESFKLIVQQEWLELLVTLLKTWQQKHKLNVQIFKSSELKNPWTEEAWQAWYQLKSKYSTHLTLTISDFCGPEPHGPFWTYLTAQTDCGILRLHHAEPNFENGKAIRDINQKDAISCVWEQKVFQENYLKWNESIDRLLRSSAVRSLQLKSIDRSNFIQSVFKLLTL